MRGFILPWRQASIAAARVLRLGGVGLVEIGKHGVDGFAEAVDIQAMEGCPARFRQALIMSPQPIGEGQHFLVAPHPCREAHEHIAPPGTRRLVPHIIVNARGIGPVRFYRHDREAVPFYQPTGDRSACPVEFGTSMCRLAQKDDPGISEPIETGTEILHLVGRGQWFSMVPESLDKLIGRLSGRAVKHRCLGHLLPHIVRMSFPQA